MPTCGCPVNAPEANPNYYPCPCGEHCEEHVSTQGHPPGPLAVGRGTGREKTLHTLTDELGDVALVYGATTKHSEEVATEIARRYNTHSDMLDALRCADEAAKALDEFIALVLSGDLIIGDGTMRATLRGVFCDTPLDRMPWLVQARAAIAKAESGTG